VSSLWENLPSSKYTAMKDKCRKQKTGRLSGDHTQDQHLLGRERKLKVLPSERTGTRARFLVEAGIGLPVSFENVAVENFNGNH